LFGMLAAILPRGIRLNHIGPPQGGPVFLA
jgi:hypothetical protein